jgi:hypothetical protein
VAALRVWRRKHGFTWGFWGIRDNGWSALEPKRAPDFLVEPCHTTCKAPVANACSGGELAETLFRSLVTSAHTLRRARRASRQKGMKHALGRCGDARAKQRAKRRAATGSFWRMLGSH